MCKKDLKVSVYDETSKEIIYRFADEIRTGLLNQVGYMFENIPPYKSMAYDMRIEGLVEEFVCSIALQRDANSDCENNRRFFLTLNTLPLPYYVNISIKLEYGGVEKLYNYLTSETGISDVKQKMRDLLLKADDWRKDEENGLR